MVHRSAGPGRGGSLPACVMLAAAWISACTSPAKRADQLAARAGFGRETIEGAAFHHVVYRNHITAAGGTLHVYIEGDGTPYSRPTMVATDPTPREPLMLRLMVQDELPSVYLGRPCYFGLASESSCKPAEWTLRRFSPEILDSMDAALRAEMARSGASRVELFGHSGGGTIAVLLAQRLPEVKRVITLAPTLDTAAWCALHHYDPLSGSLNPVDQRANRADLTVVHWVGSRDSNTPPSLVSAAAAARGEQVRVVAGFSHNCCWEKMWGEILEPSAKRNF
jgi:hypothetical protein